jgi:hypothetical protein
MAYTLDQIMSAMDSFQTSKGAPRKREFYSPLPVRSIRAMGWAGTRSILYLSEIQSETKRDSRYLSYIQFYDLEVANKKTSKTPTALMIEDKVFWFSIPTSASRVAMSCMCRDFTFTWEKELFDVGSLIGRWRPYQRKTTYMPPRNPKNVPGFCKHVWSLITQLSSSDLLYKS